MGIKGWEEGGEGGGGLRVEGGSRRAGQEAQPRTDSNSDFFSDSLGKFSIHYSDRTLFTKQHGTMGGAP